MRIRYTIKEIELLIENSKNIDGELVEYESSKIIYIKDSHGFIHKSSIQSIQEGRGLTIKTVVDKLAYKQMQFEKTDLFIKHNCKLMQYVTCMELYILDSNNAMHKTHWYKIVNGAKPTIESACDKIDYINKQLLRRGITIDYRICEYVDSTNVIVVDKWGFKHSIKLCEQLYLGFNVCYETLIDDVDVDNYIKLNPYSNKNYGWIYRRRKYKKDQMHSFYLIKCIDYMDNIFLKVGLTKYKDLKIRHGKRRKNKLYSTTYDWKDILIVNSKNLKLICNLEDYILLYKNNNDMSFNDTVIAGKTECICMEHKQTIIDKIQEFCTLNNLDIIKFPDK